MGNESLFLNSTGTSNVAIGKAALYHNTTRSNLVAVGDSALYNNGKGFPFSYQAIRNTAVGSKVLFSNTIGYSNTAIGFEALFSNTTGYSNTAVGDEALRSNTTGYWNTAVGEEALHSNISGTSNTAIGHQALFNNTSHANTAIGRRSMYYNTNGDGNTALGWEALLSNTSGDNNTAIGVNALSTNTSGFGNVGLGNNTGNNTPTNQYSTFIGHYADFTTGNFPDVYYSTAIGYNARVDLDNQVRIGHSGITSIGGFQDWTNVSDGRYKQQVSEDVKGLDFILRLRPVTYNLDVRGLSRKLGESESERNTAGRGMPADQMRHSGFIAQEVEVAARQAGFDFSGVDAPQNAGGLYGLRYAEFTVPLVKAVQEQQALIEAQQAEIEHLKKQAAETATLRAQLDKITAALQTAGIGVGN